MTLQERARHVLLVLYGFRPSAWRQDPMGHARLSALRRHRLDVSLICGELGAAATLATGARPPEHGVLSGLIPDRAAAEPRPASARSYQTVPLWNATDAAGRSAAIINWPGTSPVQAFNTGDRTQIVAPSAIALGPILPPYSVAPPSHRPSVRSIRATSGDDKLGATRAALSLTRSASADVTCCWISAASLGPQQPDAAAMVVELAQAVSPSSHLSIAVVPHSPVADRPIPAMTRGTLWSDWLPAMTPVVRDIDLAPAIAASLGICGTTPTPMPASPTRAQVNARAAAATRAGLRSVRGPSADRDLRAATEAMARCFAADAWARREHGAATRWLEVAASSAPSQRTLELMVLMAARTADSTLAAAVRRMSKDDDLLSSLSTAVGAALGDSPPAEWSAIPIETESGAAFAAYTALLASDPAAVAALASDWPGHDVRRLCRVAARGTRCQQP